MRRQFSVYFVFEGLSMKKPGYLHTPAVSDGLRPVVFNSVPTAIHSVLTLSLQNTNTIHDVWLLTLSLLSQTPIGHVTVNPVPPITDSVYDM